MRFPCVHAVTTTPAQRLGSLLLNHPAVSAFPEMAIGSACTTSFSRLAQCSLTLRPAHSRCHQFAARFTGGFNHFCYLHSCSGCFRLEQIAGWGLHPLEKRRLTTAHAISNGMDSSSPNRHLGATLVSVINQSAEKRTFKIVAIESKIPFSTACLLLLAELITKEIVFDQCT